MRVFLGLGSNLGNRRKHLCAAVKYLERYRLLCGMSSVYETEPVGGPEQGPYLNLVAEIETELDPRDLLALCQRMERLAGRERQVRWGPRVLDVDVLWVEGVTVDDPDLQIPHPRMWDRRFVLAPLRELAPELVDEAAVQRAAGEVKRMAASPCRQT